MSGDLHNMHHTHATPSQAMPSQARGISDAFAGERCLRRQLMPSHSSDAFTSDAFAGNQAMQAHACMFFLFLGRLDASKLSWIMTRGPSLHRLAFAGTLAGRICKQNALPPAIPKPLEASPLHCQGSSALNLAIASDDRLHHLGEGGQLICLRRLRLFRQCLRRQVMPLQAIWPLQAMHAFAGSAFAGCAFSGSAFAGEYTCISPPWQRRQRRTHPGKSTHGGD